jgi:hypothetical protein
MQVAEDFCWGELAARVLHPVQVEVIEALRWIDRPLTATDLLRVLDSKRIGLRIEHHLKRLTRLNALAAVDAEKMRTPIRGQRAYRLVKRPGA